MISHSTSRTAFWTLFLEARRLLFIVPKNPDGDSVGTVTALIGVARELKKEYTAVTIQPIPHQWISLPFVEDIHTGAVPRGMSYDVAVIPDAGDFPYTGAGSILASFRRRPTLVNLDHHLTNEQYGDVNVVDSTASATTEILATILKEHHGPMTPAIATSLLTGILTDTGNFSNPATTERSVRTAAWLLEHGARFRAMVRSIRQNKNIPDLQRWGMALARLRMDNAWGMAVTVLTLRDASAFPGAGDALDGLANFLNTLDGVRAVLVLKEREGGKVQGSFRTTRDDVDVSRLALFFGGGGHKKAAGFTMEGRIVESRDGWRVE